MSFQQLIRQIRGDSPGSTTELRYYKVGDLESATAPKVYLQAALHADEQPGILILHHLLALLKEADFKGELFAQFVVMPMVNPLGMGGLSFNQHQGRYDAVSGVNFNRKWPRLYDVIAKAIEGKLSQNVEENQHTILTAVSNWLVSVKSVSALEQQRHFVIQEAFDADYVLDLHCDNDALVHLFAVPQLRESSHHLATWIGAAATLLAEDSGGGSFDEVWPSLWIDAARANPDHPIFLKVKASGTLEYRGQMDVFDAINKQDAIQLYGFFQEQGLIAGEMIVSKPSDAPEPTDLNATEMLRVDQSGLLAYSVELGEVVES